MKKSFRQKEFHLSCKQFIKKNKAHFFDFLHRLAKIGKILTSPKPSHRKETQNPVGQLCTYTDKRNKARFPLIIAKSCIFAAPK